MEKFKSGVDSFEKKDSNNEGRREHKFAEEMEKPREEWSEEFKSFVDKKIRENELENQQDELIEILKGTINKREEDWSEREKDAYRKRKEFIELQERDEKETIDMYFDNLELTEGEISSKKIIDIGCGRNAELVEYAVEKLNSKNVYGLDRDFEDEVLQKYPHNLYKGDYYESLPVDNLDLIVARASIDIKDLMQENFLENILNSLSEKGEFRVYPIFKNHFESNYKEALAVEDELIKTIDKFSKQFNFDYELKTKEVSVYGKDEYPMSKSLLTIMKKEEDLRNDEVVNSILIRGDAKKLEELREFYNLSEEEIKLCKYFALLRRETHEEMKETLKERLLNDPEPTEEEESLCVYKEEIEPQVLDAVISMRGKGYDTYESGFYGSNMQRIGVNNNSLEGVELPSEVVNIAKEKKVEVKIKPDGIDLFCKKYIDLEEIKEIWDKIAEALPDRNKAIDVNSERLEAFKGRIENMKKNPNKFFE